jgi:hypothetical protein
MSDHITSPKFDKRFLARKIFEHFGKLSVSSNLKKYLWMLKKRNLFLCKGDFLFSMSSTSSFILEGFLRPTNVSTKIWSLKRRSINLEMSYLLTGEKKDRFGKYKKKSRLKTFLRNWNNFCYKKYCQRIKNLRKKNFTQNPALSTYKNLRN